MTSAREARSPLLRTRILGAMALVVIAGAGTLMVGSLLLAPAIFYNHLEQAGTSRDEVLAAHVDEGFATAIVVSTVVGVTMSAIVAAAMATLVARRISRPVAVAARATTQLANGDYSARVPPARMGPELESLSTGINALAERLETSEGTRIRLMSDLAHELRTPIAAIDATVEAITDGVLPADERALSSLTGNAQRLSRLVDDLASVSRAEERAFRLELGDVDLCDLARQSIATTAVLAASKDVRVTGPIGAGPRVLADPDRIIEVIGQLLDNALHACTDGGSIVVATSSGETTAALTVTDSGVGFAPEEANRIFQRFYRARPANSGDGGSGIGLTIAASLVAAHHGTLTATSAGPGAGATFTMTLPLS